MVAAGTDTEHEYAAQTLRELCTEITTASIPDNS